MALNGMGRLWFINIILTHIDRCVTWNNDELDRLFITRFFMDECFKKCPSVYWSQCSPLVLRHMEPSAICIHSCNYTEMHLHTLAHSQTRTNTNKTGTHLHNWKQLWNQTGKVGILSLPLCMSLLFICSTLCLSASSQSHSPLSLFCVSASHFAVIEVNGS